MTYLGYKDDGSFPQFVLDAKQTNDDVAVPTSMQRGKRVYLPSFNNCRYKTTYVRNEFRTISEFGNPDLLLVVGCNPYWPEVTRYLEEFNLQISDCEEIILRVLKRKLDSIVHDIVQDSFFGLTNAVSWIVGFQEFDLPKAYVYVYLQENSKFQNILEVDRKITAEIPDVQTERELHSIVQEFMIAVTSEHNEFPKNFADSTTISPDGTMVYRRRKNGVVVVKESSMYDNRWVIPYNPSLSLRYHTYLSVERVVPELNVLRNLCVLLNTEQSASKGYEWIWEKLGLPKTFRTIDVVQVGFHLPETFINCMYTSAFESWMEFNRFNGQSKTLTYTQFAGKYVWDTDNKRWIVRNKGKALARLPTVSSWCGELYYLRCLLNVVVGPRSFQDILTVDGYVCQTFKEACIRGSLVDD